MTFNGYFAGSMSAAELLAFCNELAEGGNELRQFELWQGDRCLARAALPPYTTTDKMQLYSLSKSFCATAVGLAADRGLLSVDDPVLHFFPDCAPAHPSENLRAMTVHHLLSMNTGHDCCQFPEVIDRENGPAAFLSAEVPHKPGTHFAYNTGASYMCAAIVERVTGMSLFDFLRVNLFRPLGISPARWQRQGGHCEGGIGLYADCSDIAAFGRLYLGRGVFEGKRLLSEAWCDSVWMPHSDNSANGTSDWCAGYGYQFWRNERGGYRGDGAFGQLCIIYPAYNAVLALLTSSTNMGITLTAGLNLIEKVCAPGAARTSTDEQDAAACRALSSLYAPLPGGSVDRLPIGKIYCFDPNPCGFTTLTLRREENAVALEIGNGESCTTLRAGAGAWLRSAITAPSIKPELAAPTRGLYSPYRPETLDCSLSYETTDDGRLRLAVRLRNAVHQGEMVFSFTDGGFVWESSYRTGSIHTGAERMTGREIH